MPARLPNRCLLWVWRLCCALLACVIIGMTVVTFDVGLGRALLPVRRPFSEPNVHECGFVNIVSYNVQSFPSWAQSAIYAPNDDRIEHIAGTDVLRAPHVDVVVLQEAFSTPTATRLTRDLSAMGFKHITKPGRRSLLLSGGVLVATRTDVVREASQAFRRCCGTDCLSFKGFTFVETRIDGRSVGIVGTHLQSDDPLCASWSTTTYEQARRIRQDQIRQIRQFVDRDENAHLDVVILAGDMNVNRRQAASTERGSNPDEWAEMVHVLEAAPMVLETDGALTDHSVDPDTNAYLRRLGGHAHEHLDYVLSLRVNGRSGPPRATSLRVRTARHPTTNRDLSDHHPVHGRVPL